MSEERKAAERLAVKGLGAILLIVFLCWAVPQIWDKLSPFIIAIPLASALQPAIRFAQEKLRIKRGISALICVLIMLAILAGFAYWGVAIVLEQAPTLVGQSGSMITDAINTVQQAFENLVNNSTSSFSPQVQTLLRNTMQDALNRISAYATEIAANAVSFTVGMVTSLPYGVIYISFLAMAMYFITIHYSEIRSYLPGGKRRRQDSNTTQLTNSATRSMMGYLRVQGTFALMVLVVSLIALKCFGFKYFGALSVVAALMEMIPMVGSGLMYIMMSIVFFLTGNTAWGFQVLALTGVLQLLRRLLEPKLMSNNIGISPLLSLIGMFVGMRLGGILGLIGGPVAMAVLVGAVRGDVFRNVKADVDLVVEWFKRRWAKAEPAEGAGAAAVDANAANSAAGAAEAAGAAGVTESTAAAKKTANTGAERPAAPAEDGKAEEQQP
ncbi:MAG: AI-2E family transporter [Clostridia bacterium]